MSDRLDGYRTLAGSADFNGIQRPDMLMETADKGRPAAAGAAPAAPLSRRILGIPFAVPPLRWALRRSVGTGGRKVGRPESGQTYRRDARRIPEAETGAGVWPVIGLLFGATSAPRLILIAVAAVIAYLFTRCTSGCAAERRPFSIAALLSAIWSWAYRWRA